MTRRTGKDSRIYITVANTIMENPKIEVLSDRAFRSLIGLWCWSSRNLKNGEIPHAVWMMKTTAKTRSELLQNCLAEPTDSGVYMHDYLKHQNSKEEVEALRAKRIRAGSLGGLSTAAARADAAWRRAHA